MIQVLGSAPSAQLSTPLVLGIGALALVELALIVVALVNLIKRPAAAIRFHTKWPWPVLIVMVSLIGPLVYLAVGRIDAPRSNDIDAGDARLPNAHSAPPTCSTARRPDSERGRGWASCPTCPASTTG